MSSTQAPIEAISGEVLNSDADAAIQTVTIRPTMQPSSLLKAETLEQSLQEWAAQRKVITRYIAEQFTPGVDFGRIHFKKDCKVFNCANEYHLSKPSLWKPGAEKFVALFQLEASFHKDTETWEMLGSPAGVLCYVCTLRTRGGEIVGEGRGACDVRQRGGNANEAIKMAQKSSMIDSVLRTGALSDVFTQDLEDRPPSTDVAPAMPRQAPAPVAPRRPAPTPTVREEVLDRLERSVYRFNHAGLNKEVLLQVFAAHPGNIREVEEVILTQHLATFRHICTTLDADGKPPFSGTLTPTAWVADEIRKLAAGTQQTVRVAGEEPTDADLGQPVPAYGPADPDLMAEEEGDDRTHVLSGDPA